MKRVALDQSSQPIFVGCACDKGFVEPTAVMLTSLAINGKVPEAQILIAGFGLDRRDRALLRAGAGRMAGRMRFIDVTSDMLKEVNHRTFTASYPVAVLGRLFIAAHIAVPDARLLTIDSDMIVNASLRPLFDLDLGDAFFAAIHAPLRVNDLNYFNSGLTLSKVDEYKRLDVAARCLHWLTAQTDHPAYPDQDALNAVVGDAWCRLDRSWNYFCYGERRYTIEDYEQCRIAHFAGPKPWDDSNHPGAPLYDRYLARVRAKRSRLARTSAFLTRLVGRVRPALVSRR